MILTKCTNSVHTISKLYFEFLILRIKGQIQLHECSNTFVSLFLFYSQIAKHKILVLI